jgi:uncharacterized membrane protein
VSATQGETGMATLDQQSNVNPMPSVVTVANIVYALHAFAIVLGIVGTATVVGSFIGSLPSIVAVIMNYVKRADARGTWVESHYRWQIRTFWYALLWFVIGWALILTLVGVVIGGPILIALTVWLVYRIGRGWLRLSDQRPMYV